MRKSYDGEFFASIRENSRNSAAAVVPLVLRWMQPNSVVDVGCGTGGWLAEFKRHGVAEIVGIDGEYVPREMLEIPQESFRTQELASGLQFNRRFDLAVSLEVAEHLPPESAGPFVQSLTRLAPVVLFSAAIPFQGGTNHINEQWPEYWAALFASLGFDVLDCIRPLVWGNPGVDVWYRQNILMFVSDEGFARYPELRNVPRADPKELAMVQPRFYLNAAQPGFRQLLRGLGPAMLRAVRRRLSPKTEAPS
jgi:SAM-dependent methyltransferase